MTGIGSLSRLTQLQDEGLVMMPSLPPAQVDAMNTALDACPRYAGHVKREGRPYTGQPISCWDMHDVLCLPYFWDWALAVTPLAAAYLGVPPLLYSVNVFESVPDDLPPHPGIESVHRDYDDTRFVALFLYLTDVDRDGAHEFHCGTHEGGPATHPVHITGPRGTAFLADTRGQHRAGRPTTGPRRIAWARWGVSDPPTSYVKDCLRPMARERLGDRYPTDPALQRLIRLVVA